MKSNGLCPRRFEPCQLRTVLSSFQPKFAQNYLPPVGFEPTTPSLRDWCSTTELKRPFSCTCVQLTQLSKIGSVAEWSKALVLGTSQKWRGFESHHCQPLFGLQNRMETPGIEPGTSRMRSERSTPELHPPSCYGYQPGLDITISAQLQGWPSGLRREI